MLARLPHGRFLLFLALLAGVSGAALSVLPPALALVLGFDVAVLGFVLTVLPLWRTDRPDAARARSARDDGGRVLLPVTAAVILAVVLVALGVLASGRDGLAPWALALGAGTLGLAWIFGNLVMAFHYAHLWYDPGPGGDAGGIDFPGEPAPVLADFVYLAFVIGMTAKVADTAVTSRRMRRVVTVHGFLAFAFNLGVLALAINTLAAVV